MAKKKVNTADKFKSDRSVSGLKKVIYEQLDRRIPGRPWGLGGDDNTIVIDEDRAKLHPVREVVRVFFKNDKNAVPRLVNHAKRMSVDLSLSEDERFDAYNYLLHEDGKSLYLGLPQKHGTIEVSPYKPADSKDPNAVYYRYKDGVGVFMDPEELLDNFGYLLSDLIPQDLKYHYAESPVFRSTKYSVGEDERGSYISAYKKYDYNLPFDESNAPEFYDRVYLDDAFGFDQEDKGSHWLPQVDIYAPLSKELLELTRNRVREIFDRNRIDPDVANDLTDEQLTFVRQQQGPDYLVLENMLLAGIIKDWNRPKKHRRTYFGKIVTVDDNEQKK